MKRSIELLAPAKNLACGLEAIRHGADAVYIGAERFGARAAAGNSVDDIGQLCRFAHQFQARVYVTVNTILFDHELDDTRRLIWQLYEAGVDALIVQDLALLRLDLPPIPLHASTQMDNRTPEKALWLGRQGYRQVVLARELSLEQIGRIHEALEQEAQQVGQPAPVLEAFVHGALCVSYSGRCYASQHCFGRSANRGECAQFCRLAFDLVDAQGRVLEHDRHLLSLRDMNRSAYLEQMIDAGVGSFKIEGRLKDVAYVKNITAYYRQLLDAVLRRRPDLFRASLGRCTYTFTPDASKSFNRGFTDYFLNGRTGREANFVTPKAMGEQIGHVKEVRPNAILVATTASLTNGDGFCFVDAAGRLQGFRANRAVGNRIEATVPGLAKGMTLFRNQDSAFERLLARPSAQRTIDVVLTLTDTPTGFLLCLSIDGVSEPWATVSRRFDYPHQLANTPQADNQRRQLARLGDTPFRATDIRIDLSQNWFVPSSVLAEWRRQVADALVVPAPVRLPAHRSDDPSSASAPCPPMGSAAPDYTANVANHLAREVWRHSGAADVAPAFELDAPPHATLMTCRHCLRYSLGFCPRTRPTKPEPPQPWALRLPDGRRFPLQFDCRRCEMSVMS